MRMLPVGRDVATTRSDSERDRLAATPAPAIPFPPNRRRLPSNAIRGVRRGRALTRALARMPAYRVALAGCTTWSERVTARSAPALDAVSSAAFRESRLHPRSHRTRPRIPDRPHLASSAKSKYHTRPPRRRSPRAKCPQWPLVFGGVHR